MVTSRKRVSLSGELTGHTDSADNLADATPGPQVRTFHEKGN